MIEPARSDSLARRLLKRLLRWWVASWDGTGYDPVEHKY
jgi:hypothetical protein